MADSSPGLPADIISGGQAPTGIGLKPALELIAGQEEAELPPRPVRAAANDAAFDHGIIAEGRCDGAVDTERKIPWL